MSITGFIYNLCRLSYKHGRNSAYAEITVDLMGIKESLEEMNRIHESLKETDKVKNKKK